MRWLGPTSLWFVLLGGCSGVPRLAPARSAEAATILAHCRARYAPGSWQAVHAIDFHMPGGQRSALLGVVTGDSRTGTLRLVALAPEGMTLLELRSDPGKLRVDNAVPPFTKRALVQGMERDVRLMLFTPAGRAAAGRLPGGVEACRYRQRDGAVVDVLPKRSGGWEIRRYTPGGKRGRSVRFEGGASGRQAKRITLIAPGPLGYRLRLRLVRTSRRAD